jgi:tetratricopeptide (TPR) repeat protein
LRQGKYTEAELFFAQALTEKAKMLPLINKEIGRAYLLVEWASPKQIIDNAIKAEKYLTSVAEEDWEAKLLLGDAYMMSKGNDLSFAVTQYITAGNELPNDPRPLLKEAIVYRRVQNYELSKIRIQESLLKEKEYAPAYRQLAEVFGLLKDKDSSIYFYKEYLKRNNNLSARRRFVEMLYLNGQFDEAISEGKDLLAVHEFPNIYGVIAYAYVGKKNTTVEENKEALANFKLYEQKYVPSQNRGLSSKESFNKANLMVRDSMYDEGYQIYSTVLADTGKCQESWYDVAREQLFAATKYQYALTMLELKKVKRKGKLPQRDLFYMGRCYNRMKKYNEEIAINREIIANDSNYLTGYLTIARARAQMDKYDSLGASSYEYKIWLNRLDSTQKVKFKDDIETAYRNMAFYAQKAKKYELASEYYGKVISMKPEDTDVIAVKAKLDDYLTKLKAREAKMKAAPTKK